MGREELRQARRAYRAAERREVAAWEVLEAARGTAEQAELRAAWMAALRVEWDAWDAVIERMP